MIGLKYNLKREGRGLRWWLSNICREIKYAWQRAWRGYDDVDVFDLFSHFRDRMIPILKDFKKYNVGGLVVPEGRVKFIKQGYIDEADKCKLYTKEEEHCIFDVMINHLKMMDKDYVIEVLYGQDWYESGVKIDYKKVRKIQNQNKELFFHLLETFYYQLWV